MGLGWEDLNPATWPGQVRKRLGKDLGGIADDPASVQEDRADRRFQGRQASDFAAWGQQGFHDLGTEAKRQREALLRRANGADSLSAEQLRQGVGQQYAAQRSMAASAAPQNAAMAARAAANNMARANYGMAGQAATAGIQERAQAQDALSKMLMEQRQQELQAALQSRQNALTAYGAQPPEKSGLDKYGPAAAAAAGLVFSDRNLKTDIEDGDEKAKKVLKGLKAYSYKYKDEANGKGDQFGPMAQDLEAAGLGHTVINTRKGKMVDGGRAALSSLALTASLAKRVEQLEAKKK